MHPCIPTAGDISGAAQTLRALLLFYPSDKDSLDNLQLYSETLGGDTESQDTQPAQVRFITLTPVFAIITIMLFTSPINKRGALTIKWSQTSDSCLCSCSLYVCLNRRLSDTSVALCRRRSCYILAWRTLTSLSLTQYVPGQLLTTYTLSCLDQSTCTTIKHIFYKFSESAVNITGTHKKPISYYTFSLYSINTSF